MKPRPFEYVAATTLEQVLDLLAKADQDVKILAGGQSLIPAMNFGLARPAILVDITRIPGLAYITRGESGIAIGATTRHYEVEDSQAVGEAFPLVTRAMSHVGHRAIRHRGTVGGSLSHADPSAEWGALATALEVEFTVRSSHGSRTMGPGGFFAGPLMTGMRPDELLTGVTLPYLPAGARSAFYEVARRIGDFALAGVSVVVQTDEAGVCTFARLGLCGVGPVPLRAGEAEAALVGTTLTPAALAEAGRLAAAAADPDTDVHGTAAYRKMLVGVCVRRALAMALGDLALAGSVNRW